MNNIGSTTPAAEKYTVVEYKYCEDCGNRFMREIVALRKLTNGKIIDPNRYCPTCEHKMAKNAAIQSQDLQRIVSDPQYASFPRGDTPGEEMHREKILGVRPRTERVMERMTRECLRKQAFTDPTMAAKVAKRSRRRTSDAPITAYKCKAVIDPVLADTDPDLYTQRTMMHWHVGTDNDRVLQRRFNKDK